MLIHALALSILPTTAVFHSVTVSLYSLTMCVCERVKEGGAITDKCICSNDVSVVLQIPSCLMFHGRCDFTVSHFYFFLLVFAVTRNRIKIESTGKVNVCCPQNVVTKRINMYGSWFPCTQRKLFAVRGYARKNTSTRTRFRLFLTLNP